jgi:hypothetical protein
MRATNRSCLATALMASLLVTGSRPKSRWSVPMFLSIHHLKADVGMHAGPPATFSHPEAHGGRHVDIEHPLY